MNHLFTFCRSLLILCLLVLACAGDAFLAGMSRGDPPGFAASTVLPVVAWDAAMAVHVAPEPSRYLEDTALPERPWLASAQRRNTMVLIYERSDATEARFHRLRSYLI